MKKVLEKISEYFNFDKDTIYFLEIQESQSKEAKKIDPLDVNYGIMEQSMI